MSKKQRKAALKYGYRSGLEASIQEQLLELNVPVKYEQVKIEWEDLMYRTYTPDFILPNGIIVESKGRFTADDRRKHLAVKAQHPELDIRFVFTNPNSKLASGAKTSYGQWCDKHGYKYAAKLIPTEWLKERGKDRHPVVIVLPFEKIKRR